MYGTSFLVTSLSEAVGPIGLGFLRTMRVGRPVIGHMSVASGTPPSSKPPASRRLSEQGRPFAVLLVQRVQGPIRRGTCVVTLAQAVGFASRRNHGMVVNNSLGVVIAVLAAPVSVAWWVTPGRAARSGSGWPCSTVPTPWQLSLPWTSVVQLLMW